MARILVYAHDPGGANAVKPLISALKLRNHEVFIYGGGVAVKTIPDSIEYQGDTDELINKIKPDFVLTGTSADCICEKKLRKSARKAGIKSMAILDHWVNYNRFTPYSCSELRENKKYDELEYAPDYYIVMDEIAKQGAISEGVPADIIYPLGNPHFKFIKDSFDKIDAGEIRSNLLNGKEKLIVWASESCIEDYGHGMELECLKDLAQIIPPNCGLVIKPHPRERQDKFNGFDLPVVRNITSQEAIKASDLTVSMTSMVLIESIIAGKSCLSYQKNERDKNKFILTRLGALPFINDINTLKDEINKIMEFNIKPDFKINFNATENIIEFIERKL